MNKTKRNQKIHVDTVENTIAQLKQLEAKPKLELTLRETIDEMGVELKNAIKKGYSYKELSELLAKQKIMISAGTLKQYISELNKNSPSRKKQKSTQKKSNTSQTDLQLVSKDSNDSSIKENISQIESKNKASLKEKAIARLNADININSSYKDKKPVKNKITLAEKLHEPSYFDEEQEELRREFNQF